MSMIEQPENEIFNYTKFSFNLTKLYMDQYYVILTNNMKDYVNMYISYEECNNCIPHKSYPLPEGSTSKTFNSKFSEKWYFVNSTGIVCQKTFDQNAEFGVYEMSIPECTLETLLEPVNIYLPIVSVMLIFLAVAAFIVGSIFIYNKKIKKKNDAEAPEVKRSRIQSLDAFRGLSIIIMLLVNYGPGYNFLEHAVWNGLTIADLVFPWFLWIMGVCIPISINSALRRGDRHIFRHILKRSAILFLLGIIYNKISVGLGKNIYDLRIFGVLQRFGLCYIVGASVCLAFMRKKFPEKPGVLQDILVMLPQWIFGLIFAVIHAAVTFGLEVPDCPLVGYLGPGGELPGESSENSYGSLVNCSGGAVGYVDRAVLGEKLMYGGGIWQIIYKASQPVDPEGIMGTFNAVLQVFIGIQAGITLLMYKNHIARVARWVFWGVITGLIGGGLCGFSRDEGVIPINKTLWSLSFVLVTSSLAFLVLSILYLIIDGNDKKYWSGKPFIFAGMNPIILYMGQGLTEFRFPFQWGVLEPNLHFQMLSQAVWGTMCWWIIAYWLYRIKFFLSI